MKSCSRAAAFRYSLVALYLRIQTAAAYAMMAKQTEAAALLQETLQEAKWMVWCFLLRRTTAI